MDKDGRPSDRDWVLTEPLPPFHMSSHSLKLRRTSMAFSVVGLLMAIWDLTPTKIPALGIDNIDPSLPLQWFVVACIIYFLSYFLMNALDEYRHHVYIHHKPPDEVEDPRVVVQRLHSNIRPKVDFVVPIVLALAAIVALLIDIL